MNVVLRLPADSVKDRSLIGYAVKRLAMGSPLAVASAGFLIVLVLVALMAPLVSPYSPVTQNTRENLRPPSYRHLLGTDDLGRDVFSRTIYGSRASLEVSLVAVGVS